jgi:hypothetical protein
MAQIWNGPMKLFYELPKPYWTDRSEEFTAFLLPASWSAACMAQQLHHVHKIASLLCQVFLRPLLNTEMCSNCDGDMLHHGFVCRLYDALAVQHLTESLSALRQHRQEPYEPTMNHDSTIWVLHEDVDAALQAVIRRLEELVYGICPELLHFCHHNDVPHALRSSLQQLCCRVGFPASIHEALLGENASLVQPSCNCGMVYPECTKGDYARTIFVPGEAWRLDMAEEPKASLLECYALKAHEQPQGQHLLVKHYRL